MPSTLVHLAVGAIVATALLEAFFDARSLALILLATAIPDLDSFLDVLVPGTHRAALHTFVVPALATAVLVYDLRREDSWLRERGPRTIRIAWVAIVAYAVAGIAPDMFFNGVNPLYPFLDQFVVLDGNVLYSNQRGFVQTIWEGSESTTGTTQSQHYPTGVNPRRGQEPTDVERVFPIARGGFQILIVLAGALLGGTRLWLSRRRGRVRPE